MKVVSMIVRVCQRMQMFLGSVGRKAGLGGGGVDKGERAYNQDLKTLFHIF